MTVLQAIRELEKTAGLAKECRPTTQAELTENGRKEAYLYLKWLRQQNFFSSSFVPHWEDLTRKPKKD
jgi:hypothetical protein